MDPGLRRDDDAGEVCLQSTGFDEYVTFSESGTLASTFLPVFCQTKS
jgi:hypothetical protein